MMRSSSAEIRGLTMTGAAGVSLMTADRIDIADSPTLASPFQSALSEEDLAAVRSAVSSLPGDQRQAIEMAFFGGMTHAEIAEALREPLGTIKARIRRGMLKLREGLQAYV